MAFDLSTAKPEQAVSQRKSGFDLSTAKPDAEDGFSVGEMVSNIPSSAANLAGDMWQAATNPIDTAKGVGSVIRGAGYEVNDALANYLPEPLQWMAEGGGRWEEDREQYEPYAEAAVEAIKGRYGSIDNAINTLEQDPVGALADLSAVLSGKFPRVGAAVNPVNMALNAGKYTAGKMIPKGLPESMYESVAKFSTTLPDKQRAQMVDTALENRIMPTSKGTAKLESMIGDLNTKIDDLISTATSKGESVPRTAVYKHIKELRQKKGGMSLSAPEDVRAVNRIIAEFDKHLKGKGKERLTPAELQELKKNTYEAINWDAKRMTGTPVKEDTYKAVARGTKENIEDMVPSVKETNSKLSEFYELQPHLQRAANRVENKNVLSINDAPQIGAGGAVGYTLGGSSGAAAGTAIGTLVALLGKDKVKGFNAIQLKKLANDANMMQFLKNNPNISRAELAAIIAGRQPTEEGQ